MSNGDENVALLMNDDDDSGYGLIGRSNLSSSAPPVQQPAQDNISTGTAATSVSTTTTTATTTNNESIETKSIILGDDIDRIREELQNFSSNMRLTSAKVDKEVNYALNRMDAAEVIEINEEDEEDDNFSEWCNSYAGDGSVAGTAAGNASVGNNTTSDLNLEIKEKERIIGELKKERKRLKKENINLTLLRLKSEKELGKAREEIDRLTKRVSELEAQAREQAEGGGTTPTVAAAGSSIASQQSPTNPSNARGESTFNISKPQSERIRVCLRLRPTTAKEEHNYGEKDCIDLNYQYNEFMVESPLGGEYEFSYDKILDKDATQDQVYDYTCSDYVDDLLQGVNCCVMAVGGTDSGKSYSLIGSMDVLFKKLDTYNHKNVAVSGMNNPVKFISGRQVSSNKPTSAGGTSDGTGPESNVNVDQIFLNFNQDQNVELGILPRLLHALFEKIRYTCPAHIEFTMKVSYVAIHLEKIFDLLDPNTEKSMFVNSSDYSSSNYTSTTTGQIHVENATQAYCFSEVDVLNVISRGELCHNIYANRMGVDPCYWHRIFLMNIQQNNVRDQVTTYSQFHLIELAGQMTTLSSNNVVNKLIQNSFKALKNVIKALMDGKPNVPYKDSKLTSMLTNVLGGNCRTTVLVTASPSSSTIVQTLLALRFGQRAGNVFNSPRVNYELSTETYRKWLLATELKLGELTNFVQILAKEFVKDRDKYGASTLWDSIWAIVDEEERASNPCRKSLCYGNLSELNNSKSLKWKTLSSVLYQRIPSYEFTSLVSSYVRAESLLKTKISEVEILTQQKNFLQQQCISSSKTVVDLENRIQSLLLTKSEMEYQLTLSQFRENEAKIFLKHIRLLCKSYQEDLSTFGQRHGGNNAAKNVNNSANENDLNSSIVQPGVSNPSASIVSSSNNASSSLDVSNPITTISSTYIMESSPTLKDLIDVDSYLLEAGLLDSEDFPNVSSQSTQNNRKQQRRKLATEGNNNVNNEWNVFEQHISALQNFVQQSYFVTKDAGSSPEKSSGSSLAVIDENLLSMSSVSVSPQDNTSHSTLKLSNTAKNSSDENNSSELYEMEQFKNITENPNILNSFSPWLAYINRLSKEALGSPSALATNSDSNSSKQIQSQSSTGSTVSSSKQKLFISNREKQLEKDIRLIAKKCLELKMQLDEVMILSRYGNLKNNRLAQETLMMKKENRKYMADAKIATWKLQELQVMNKALHRHAEDTKNYISILEEHLQKLQNSCRENVLSYMDNQSKQLQRFILLENIMESLLGSNSFNALTGSFSLNGKQPIVAETKQGEGEVSMGDLKKVDPLTYALALVNLPIHGYYNFVKDEKVEKKSSEDDEEPSEGTLLADKKKELGDMYSARPPDYVRKEKNMK